MAQVAHTKRRSSVSKLTGLVKRPTVAVAAVCAVAGAVAGSGISGGLISQGQTVSIERGSGQDTSSSHTKKATEQKVVVDVAGAVVAPNVVELADGDRVDDAINACGGLAEDADISALNRASVLTDGQKIYVPRQGEQAVAADTTAAAGGGASSSAATSSGELVNINTATAEELDTLPGVGPSTAAAIIEDRTQNGVFATAEDLMRVSGIGEKKFANMKSSICV